MCSLFRVNFLVCSTEYTILAGGYNGVLGTLYSRARYIFLRHPTPALLVHIPLSEHNMINRQKHPLILHYAQISCRTWSTFDM